MSNPETKSPTSIPQSTALAVVQPLLDMRPVADLPLWAQQEVAHTAQLFAEGTPPDAIVVSAGVAVPVGVARRNLAKLHAKALADRARRLGL